MTAILFWIADALEEWARRARSAGWARQRARALAELPIGSVVRLACSCPSCVDRRVGVWFVAGYDASAGDSFRIERGHEVTYARRALLVRAVAP